MPEIALPTGIIDYHDTGSGPPVVLVHGALVDAQLWRPLIERLEPTHRCIAPELPLGSHRRAMAPDADITPHGVAFIHQEIYQDNDANKPVQGPVAAWQLQTEPWTFVIDRTGRIAARFEGAFSAGELERAIAKVS